jgi:hypothetical protein
VKAKAHPVHSIPGRTRFKISERRGDHIFFDEVAGRLRNCAGVSEVECNPLTGSVLIHHSGDIDGPPMRAALHRLDEIVELELAPPPIARRLRADAIGLDQAITRLSGGEFDLSTVAALGLLALAGGQLVSGAQPVIAITLAWYATELLRRWEEPPCCVSGQPPA